MSCLVNIVAGCPYTALVKGKTPDRAVGRTEGGRLVYDLIGKPQKSGGKKTADKVAG